MSSQVVLTFRCLPNFYRGFIQGFSKIAASRTSMLRMSSSTDLLTSSTQIVVWYDRVNNGHDSSGDSNRKCLSNTPKLMCPPAPFTSILRTSSSTDSSTSSTQIVVMLMKLMLVVVVVVISTESVYQMRPNQYILPCYTP